MKICVTLSCTFPGETGTPLHIMGHVRELKKKGFDVFIVQFMEGTGFHVIKDHFEEIPVYRIPLSIRTLYLMYLLRREKPDVIHTHHITAAVSSFIPAKVLRVPFIYEAHAFWKEETEMLEGRKSIFFYIDKFAEKYILKHGDRVIVMSEKMKLEFIKQGVPEEKIVVIYPGVDLPRFNERNVSQVNIEGVTGEDLIIMYAGNFQPWQGLDILLESIPYVIEQVPDVKFVIVGGRNKEIEIEKKKINKFSDKVIFIERQPHEIIPDYLSKADILVIPRPDSPVNHVVSKKTGEYLAMGKAVVATDVGDFRTILIDNECGIVTEPTGEGFARGLIKILMEDEARSVYGSNAREVALKFFNWNRSIERLIKIYKSLN